MMAKSGWGSVAKSLQKSGTVVRLVLKSGRELDGFVDVATTTDSIIYLTSPTDSRNRHVVDVDEVAAMSSFMLK